MYQNKLEDFEGGNRIGKQYESVFQACQTDWLAFGGAWSLKDNGVPIVMAESLSVMGTKFYEWIAQNIKQTPVFTNISPLHEKGPFVYQPYPYDFHTIRTAHTPHSNPLNRRNQAGYIFGRKMGLSVEINLFGLPIQTLYNLRYQLEQIKGIVKLDPGPMMLDKFKALEGYKFGLAAENCAAPGYITEKLWDCLVCDIVPIYIGGPLPEFLEQAVFRIRDLGDIQKAFMMTDLEYLERLEYNRKVLFDPRIDFYSCRSVCSEILKKCPAEIQNKIGQIH